MIKIHMKPAYKKFTPGRIIRLFVLGILMAACTHKPQKPNILFIFADQLRSQELSCYGGKNIQTPNMDRLAHEGLRMTNEKSFLGWRILYNIITIAPFI